MPSTTTSGRRAAVSRHVLAAAAVVGAAAWLGVAASDSWGSAAAVAESRITGAEIVWSAATVAPGRRAGVEAVCPSGKVVLSGGFIVPQGRSLDVYRSAPVGSNRWVTALENNRGLFEGPPVSFRAYALCVNSSTLVGRETVASTAPMGGPGEKTWRAPCPAGKVATGGGFSAAKHDPAPSVQWSRHSGHDLWEGYWQVRLLTRGYAVELPTWVAFAICVDRSDFHLLNGLYDDTTAWNVIPRNAPTDVVASCPSGSVMVGADFAAVNNSQPGLQFVRVFASYPLSLRSWRTQAQYIPPATWRDDEPWLRSTVLCFEPR